MIKIKKGLTLPISGPPEFAIYDASHVTSVALLGPDYVGMKPTMHVQKGVEVKTGQLLFECKKSGLKYTSPGTGTVREVNRGDKRALESVVIDLNKTEEFIEFKKYASDQLGGLTRQAVLDELLESGLLPTLRTRPFSKGARPDQEPNSIFVNAMDTNPHAPNVSLIIDQLPQEFEDGLKVLGHLTKGKIFVCHDASQKVPGQGISKVTHKAFSGPHPAGNTGTHIHYLDPVGKNKLVWTVNYQDVMNIGHLFTQGKIKTEKIISLAGPQVERPRMLRTRQGANLSDLTKDELKNTKDQSNRLISGSVLSGRVAAGNFTFLGRFHHQVSALQEGRHREFLGWMSAGVNKFSIKNIFLSYFNKGKRYEFDTNTNGSPRAMVPIGMYEKIFPFDTNATFLLRSLLSEDTDLSQDLGVLQFDEEDLALCTYVCPGKTDYGPLLRDNLQKIENEG